MRKKLIILFILFSSCFTFLAILASQASAADCPAACDSSCSAKQGVCKKEPSRCAEKEVELVAHQWTCSEAGSFHCCLPACTGTCMGVETCPNGTASGFCDAVKCCNPAAAPTTSLPTITPTGTEATTSTGPMNPFAGIPFIGGSGSSATTNPNTIIKGVINTALGIVGAIALIMLIYGGAMWMIARNNPSYVKTGKETLIWATIGLVMIFGSYIFTNYLFIVVAGPQGEGTETGTGAGAGSAATVEVSCLEAYEQLGVTAFCSAPSECSSTVSLTCPDTTQVCCTREKNCDERGYFCVDLSIISNTYECNPGPGDCDIPNQNTCCKTDPAGYPLAP